MRAQRNLLAGCASLGIHSLLWLGASQLRKPISPPDPAAVVLRVTTNEKSRSLVPKTPPSRNPVVPRSASSRSRTHSATQRTVPQRPAAEQPTDSAAVMGATAASPQDSAVVVAENCLSFCGGKSKSLLPGTLQREAWTKTTTPRTPSFETLTTPERLARVADLEPLAQTLRGAIRLPASLAARTGALESSLTFTSVPPRWTVSQVSGDPHLRAVLFESVRANLHTDGFLKTLSSLSEPSLRVKYSIENSSGVVSESLWQVDLLSADVLLRQKNVRLADNSQLLSAWKDPRSGKAVVGLNLVGTAMMLGKWAAERSSLMTEDPEVRELEKSPAFASTGPFEVSLLLTPPPTPLL